MDIFLTYLKVFITGGVICALGQILIDKTSLTTARILVIYVVAGILLSAFGVYQYIVDFGGAGATIPLSGFGHNLYKGVAKAVNESGLIGAFTGGVTAAAAGISAAVFFGYIAAIIGNTKAKK